MSALDISLETANRLYSWGWRASFAGALVTLAGVCLLMWGTRVRDRDTENQLSNSKERTATLEVRAEELRSANLKLETELLELQKNVRGREVTDQQHDQIVAAIKGIKVPEVVTYIAPDPEARMYGLSLVSVFQELGMRGQFVFLEGTVPTQTGVMYCRDGTDEDVAFAQVLMDASVVGINASPDLGVDKSGKKIVRPYCPPGSVFVGSKNPLSTFRTPHPRTSPDAK